MRSIDCIVIGAGGRGTRYSDYFLSKPESGRIIAVAEPHEDRLKKIGDNHHIRDSVNLVQDWRKLAQRTKFADAVIIATPDQMHCEPAIAFAKKGYHILLEKPMAHNKHDCEQICQAAIENNIIFCVCHVLRYTPYTTILKQILDSGIIGEIVSIEHLEPVGYWHQAHSFIRGNSRNTALQSSMLLQKSCHDFDWLRYVIGKRCIRVSSFGNLKHFKAENRPVGASDRCVNCAVEQKCPFSAIKIYLKDHAETGYFGWPVSMLTSDLTVEGIKQALTTGPYGRCVYACDNDVVDHQVAILEFEDSVTASFTMTGLSKPSDRKTKIFGTRGQLEGDGERIVHYDFLTDKTATYDVAQSDGSIKSGHGGGDYGIMTSFVKAVSLNDASYILSGAEETLETHKMVFAAECSRLENRVVDV